MECRNERSRSSASTVISESTIPARIPQLVRWRWRTPTYWFGSSVHTRAKSEAPDGGLLDTGWLKARARWPAQKQLRAAGRPATACAPGRPHTTASTATFSGGDAQFCKFKKNRQQKSSLTFAYLFINYNFFGRCTKVVFP